MRDDRYFSCKVRVYTTYDCLKKEKIAASSESVDKDSESLRKK